MNEKKNPFKQIETDFPTIENCWFVWNLNFGKDCKIVLKPICNKKKCSKSKYNTTALYYLQMQCSDIYLLCNLRCNFLQTYCILFICNNLNVHLFIDTFIVCVLLSECKKNFLGLTELIRFKYLLECCIFESYVISKFRYSAQGLKNWSWKQINVSFEAFLSCAISRMTHNRSNA